MKTLKIIFATLSIACSISAMENPNTNNDIDQQTKDLNNQANIVMKMMRNPENTSSAPAVLQNTKIQLLEILSLLENDTWNIVHVNRIIENPLLLAALLKKLNLDTNTRFKDILIALAQTHKNNPLVSALLDLNAKNRTSEESTTEANNNRGIIFIVPSYHNREWTGALKDLADQVEMVQALSPCEKLP